MIQRFSFVFFLGFFIGYSQLPAQSGSELLLQEARKVVDSLCAPALSGRGYQDSGAIKAAIFLKNQFRSAGLLPLGGHDYSQRFRMQLLVVDELSLFAMGKAWEPGASCIPYQGSAAGQVSGKVVDLGAALPPLASVRGKIAVFREELPAAMADPKNKEAYAAWLSMHDRLDSVMARGPLAVIVLQKKLTFGYTPPRLPVPVLAVLEASQQVWKGRAKLNLSYASLSPQTENVISYIPGTAVPDSFLVVSAHYDHLGKIGNSFFPGANDNASGVAMQLAMARYFTQPGHRLRHSLVFIAFGAEEVGLVGSQYFVEKDPWIPLDKIRFLLNLDLMGNGEEGITAVGGKDFPLEFQEFQHLNDSLKAIPLVKSRANAPNSDHYYFLERGVPGFFVYTLGGPPHYHDVKDTPQALQLSKYPELLNLMELLLIKLD